MPHRTPLLVTVLAATALLVGSCSSDEGEDTAAPSDVDADVVVMVDDMAFTPHTVQVAAGATVAWVFDDDVRHDVTFDDGPASPVMESSTWTHTFDEPGTYDYICSLHPDMTGTVLVTASPASTAAAGPR